MRTRTIDLTPVTARMGNWLGRDREDRLVRTLARHPWFFVLASWTLGKTYERLVENQKRREMARRPRVWNPAPRY